LSLEVSHLILHLNLILNPNPIPLPKRNTNKSRNKNKMGHAWGRTVNVGFITRGVVLVVTAVDS
jgi:hypothetical protein